MFTLDDARTGKYCRRLRPAVWNVCCGVVGCGCSLARCWVLRQHAWGFLLGPGVVSGVVFENCRVDASIFVVKLLRAHGGCLGFRSR
jgi:hypothetical protein